MAKAPHKSVRVTRSSYLDIIPAVLPDGFAPEERLCAVHHQRPPRPSQSGRAERQADARLREHREDGPMRGAVPAQLVQEVPQVVRAADRDQTPRDRQVDLQGRGPAGSDEGHRAGHGCFAVRSRAPLACAT